MLSFTSLHISYLDTKTKSLYIAVQAAGQGYYKAAHDVVLTTTKKVCISITYFI